MAEVLVVEDSRFFSSLLKREIESRLDLTVIVAESLADARRIVESNDHEFFLSLLDLTLPDATDDDVVNYILGKGMSAVVFTSNLTSEMRRKILGKNIVDYVLKDTPSSLDYLVSLVARLQKNARLTAMIVEDSATTRNYIATLLRLYRFKVIEAENGADALHILDNTPDVSLIITDNDMPEMGGVEMIRKIRNQSPRAELPIIGLSASGDNEMSARFIKTGANDFLNKPFLQEEFFYRINQTLEFAEQVRTLNDLATRDYLTGLYNRRYVMDAGQRLVANRDRGSVTLAVAMMDIDFFKKVNDTWGHEAGDMVLKAIAGILGTSFRNTDVVGRLGGEEFGVIAVDFNTEQLAGIFERLRCTIEQTMIAIGDREISVTMSIGICTTPQPTVEEMLNTADTLLYQAKEGGRNRVVIQN